MRKSRTSMVIGAMPFSLVMALMGISVLKVIWRASQRVKRGLPSTAAEIAAE